jgi:fructan beta-fructosidase
LRGTSKAIPNQTEVKESIVSQLLPQNKGTYEIEMNLSPKAASSFGFALKNSKEETLKFNFDLKNKQLSIDRTKSGQVDFNKAFAGGMTAPIIKKGNYKVRILVDKASVELFVNDGETVMTTTVFPSEPYSKMAFFAADGTLNASDIKIYNIK